MSDRLTTLPFELFEMIVLLAQSHPRTKPLYVSKAFLPFVRRPVFKVTKIKSYERLSTFLELINSTSAIIPFVIELEIKLKGKQDVGVPKNKALKTGFAHLIATEYVKLEGSSRIAKLLLAPSNDRALLSMGSLRIEDPLTGFQNPLDPSNFRWLSRYSNLHSLDLAITRDINDTGRRRNQSASAPVSSSNVNWQIVASSVTLRSPISSHPFRTFTLTASTRRRSTSPVPSFLSSIISRISERTSSLSQSCVPIAKT